MSTIPARRCLLPRRTKRTNPRLKSVGKTQRHKGHKDTKKAAIKNYLRRPSLCLCALCVFVFCPRLSTCIECTANFSNQFSVRTRVGCITLGRSFSYCLHWLSSQHRSRFMRKLQQPHSTASFATPVEPCCRVQELPQQIKEPRSPAML